MNKTAKGKMNQKKKSNLREGGSRVLVPTPPALDCTPCTPSRPSTLHRTHLYSIVPTWTRVRSTGPTQSRSCRRGRCCCRCCCYCCSCRRCRYVAAAAAPLLLACPQSSPLSFVTVHLRSYITHPHPPSPACVQVAYTRTSPSLLVAALRADH
jgi:hypothetical protein